jgi:hypothetical protein
MKTAIYFIITCFISTGALLGATNAKNPFPAFAIAFGIWALLSKKQATVITLCALTPGGIIARRPRPCRGPFAACFITNLPN